MSQNDIRKLRNAIDQTDDGILQLIERRLALAREMAAAKQDNRGSPLRPQREVAILNRLQEKAQFATDRLIEIIWRELIGHGRQAQAPMKVVLHTAHDMTLLEECARRHFSSAIEVGWAKSRQAALQAAYELPAIAAVDARIDDPGLTNLGEIKTSTGVTLAFAYAKVDDLETADL